MKKFNKTALAVGVAAAFAVGVSNAKPPRSAETASAEWQALMAAVAAGDALWHNGTIGGNPTGLDCANCHPDGSASNPHTFPKFQTNLGKVGTLREMINWCIAVPVQGKVLPSDSDEMVSLEAYSFYTHRGVAIAPAKDEQHGAVPVTDGGPGYPEF